MNVNDGAGTTALSDRLAIEDLIYRYSDAVTRADWDQLEAVFAPDAIWESPVLGLRTDGARAYRDHLAQTTDWDLIIQTAHCPVIRLLGPARAQATTTIHELVRGTSLSDTALGDTGTPVNFAHYGTYFDDIARFGAEWKFTHRVFVPIYIEREGLTGEVLTARASLVRADQWPVSETRRTPK